MAEFNPNEMTFEEGLEQLRAVRSAAKLSTNAIFTSKDEAARRAFRALNITNVPDGTTKYQLPVSLSRAQLFISVLEPNADVPNHSHDEGAGVRFIVNGSIVYEDAELSAGDWMYIPAGKAYSFRAGELGATMFYCYECCCARRIVVK